MQQHLVGHEGLQPVELLLQGALERHARPFSLHMLEEWQAVADRDGLVTGPDDEQQHLVGQGDDRQLGGRLRGEARSACAA